MPDDPVTPLPDSTPKTPAAVPAPADAPPPTAAELDARLRRVEERHPAAMHDMLDMSRRVGQPDDHDLLDRTLGLA